MFPRISMVVAVALVLALGCVSPASTNRIEARLPAVSAAAVAPRTVSNVVVFAPGIPPALLPRTFAEPARVPVFTVVGGDGDAAQEGMAADGDDLPPVPVPGGWVPAPEPSSREVLGLEEMVQINGTDEGPDFGEETGGGPDGATADVGMEGPAEDGAPDEGAEEEQAGYEIVRYEETVEVDTEVVEIGTPVLVIEGYSSWAYGPFHAVRSAPCFDPCFTPPRGACWEPVAYDPCWNPCCDPAFGSWQAFDRDCNDHQQGGGSRHVGLVIVEDGGDRAPSGGPRNPPARKPVPPPVHAAGLGAAPATGGPAAGGAGIGAAATVSGPGRTISLGSAVAARSSRETAALGRPSTGNSREVLIGRDHGAHSGGSGDGTAAMAGASSSALGPDAGGTGHRTAAARVHPAPVARDEGPAPAAAESTPVTARAGGQPSRREPAREAGDEQPVRTARHERPAPQPQPRNQGMDESRDEGSAPAPAPAPAARTESRGGRSREETPEARQPEHSRPAPASQPPESPRSHGGGGNGGGGGGGQERASERSAPPPPPPPPPPPASSGGHHR